ncbi:MAG: prolyl oligopeptidase family serine peptidase [Candidatus Cloacimonetes bacterium]|nr:prolyl oligopeptidase family serine peptidase [Candidatus Cloacimonadota bacterium]
MNKTLKIVMGLIIVVVLIIVFILLQRPSKNPEKQISSTSETAKQADTRTAYAPLTIPDLRANNYEEGNLTIERQLSNGSNFTRYIAFYKSEGNKIYGLLTIPNTSKPTNGFPAIVFMHGYIPPDRYSTIRNYRTYQAELASEGFVTYKPDLRGHGNSQGEPASSHFSQKYVIDALHAISSIKKHEYVDTTRIGYWGHSNGGEIGIRVAVITTELKAYSFWAGVVGSFEDMLETHNQKIPFLRNRNIELVQKYGLPSKNPDFWNKMDPYHYLDYVSAPIQLQHATTDPSVPVELSVHLKQELEQANKTVVLYKYQGDDHNISKNYNIAWQRTVQFFKDDL